MSDPVGLDATLARNSIARDIADVMFGTVDDGVILDVLQWQGCLLAANRIMESSRLPGTVTTEYHDRLILQAQAEINIRGNRIAELEAEVEGWHEDLRRANSRETEYQQIILRKDAEVTDLRASLELLLTDAYLGDDGNDKTPGYWEDHARFARLYVKAAVEGKARPLLLIEAENRLLRAAVDEVWRQAAREVLNGAEVVPDENGQPVFAIPGPGPIVNPGSLP
jgi:hypothetical protein